MKMINKPVRKFRVCSWKNLTRMQRDRAFELFSDHGLNYALRHEVVFLFDRGVMVGKRVQLHFLWV